MSRSRVVRIRKASSVSTSSFSSSRRGSALIFFAVDTRRSISTSMLVVVTRFPRKSLFTILLPAVVMSSAISLSKFNVPDGSGFCPYSVANCWVRSLTAAAFLPFAICKTAFRHRMNSATSTNDIPSVSLSCFQDSRISTSLRSL